MKKEDGLVGLVHFTLNLNNKIKEKKGKKKYNELDLLIKVRGLYTWTRKDI